MDDAATPETAPQTRPRPRPKRRHILRNTVLAIVFVVFAAWLILFITKGGFLKHPFERIATAMVGRPVTVKDDFQLYFAPF
jgi:hypothetical protein